ncbi:MAG: FtsW/RodA/SpoVE family cell cycle protein [Butyrivibrio sp.]|nr:FtsW/RodA/SpoVE family cell cycle protein [Butyrivibrio sp.]
MKLYVTEIAKYVIAFLLFLYTADSFGALAKPYESDRKLIYTRQIGCMFGVQISCFIQILARTGKMSYFFFFAFQLVIFASIIMLFYVIYPDANKLVVNNMCMLLMIGIIMLTRLSYEKAIKQFIIVATSIVIGFFIPELIFRLNVIKRYEWVFAAIGLAAIGVVLVLGTATNGSKITYTIAGITFQPSEFTKIIYLLFLAGALYKAKELADLIKIAGVAGVHVIILVLSKDLGSALLFFIVFLALIYIATNNIGYLFMGLGFGSVASVIAYGLFSHIQVRVKAWLDPFGNIESAGYQLSQSLFGISSGGAFGLGLYGGSPQSIPFVEQDFIFSAIAEEFGIVFAVIMTLICLSTFMHIMYEGYMIHDKYYRLLSCGIGVAYIFQTFLTIGGGSRFIPLTGVTLPLVSYGGSSVMVTVVMIMIFEGICLVRNFEEAEDYMRRDRSRGSKRDYYYDERNERYEEDY